MSLGVFKINAMNKKGITMKENTVNPMELTTGEELSVKHLVIAVKAVDRGSNSVFGVCKAYFERNKDSKTKTIRSGLTRAMNKLIEPEESHVKARVTKVVQISGDFIGYKLNSSELYFNRIEEITTLLKFFEQDDEGVLLNTFKEIRERLNLELGNPDKFSKRDYNERITALITQIKLDNKIEDAEELQFKGSKSQLIAMIKAQFANDLQEIATALLK